AERLPSTVPVWLRKILVRALSIAPEHRYPSVNELVADVERHLRPRGPRVIAGIAFALALLSLGLAARLFAPPSHPICDATGADLGDAGSEPRKARGPAAFDATGVP